ncbi:thermonuclease family protein [Methylopila sp. 73B]|uniref:thermonuclease family protein n=1 Tax=Methylopila sp. 73B TaxID=1120792 RepID=UPI0018CC238A|nr:thermonuclease family protein [Methylopila sp. 73B]
MSAIEARCAWRRAHPPVWSPIETHPSSRSAKCPLELFRAEAARDRLKALLKGREPTIDRTGADRYGRTVAVVRVDGNDVGAILVREGHAKPLPTLRRADRPGWRERNNQRGCEWFQKAN